MTGGAARHRGPAFWISAVVGWAIIAWGLRGVFHHHLDTRPADLLGLVVSRVIPGTGRSFVQAALIISGVVVLFSYPEVRGYARVLHNPTSLPTTTPPTSPPSSWPSPAPPPPSVASGPPAPP